MTSGHAWLYKHWEDEDFSVVKVDFQFGLQAGDYG